MQDNKNDNRYLIQYDGDIYVISLTPEQENVLHWLYDHNMLADVFSWSPLSNYEAESP